MSAPIVLPWPLRRMLEAAARTLLEADNRPPVDFSRPAGAPALLAPDSVSWRVFKNPVAMFIGGVTAVIMELAEPRVRTGVWEHTTFRADPVERLRRTGLAAMVTVYADRASAAAMIARVRRLHEAVAGTTPAGEPYRADDPELLTWVQCTAAYGFVEAFHRFVHPLSPGDRDRYYAEGVPVARLYGATGTPASAAEVDLLLRAGGHRLERSDIVFEFLAIMGTAPVLPRPLRPAQRLLVRAAVDLVPRWMRTTLGLDDRGLRTWEADVIRRAGAFADRLVLEQHPAVQACRRVGRPADYLYLDARARG